MRYIQNSKKILCFLFVLALFLLLSSMGCNSGELNRSNAQVMIEEADDFKSIASLNLITNAETMKNRYFVNKASDSETKEEAMIRDLEIILKKNADIAVANHLGLVNISQKFIKEQKRFMGIDPHFKIAVTIRTSEKGKALWKENDVPNEIRVDKSKELPLAVKEFGEVTVITKQGENTAIVNFTYYWIPNEFGRHLDSSEKEFQSLPDKLKKQLQGISAEKIENKTKPWKNKRTGQAIFQKFDDGWRLELVKMN